ncbi:hypothetical protein CHUAL_000519 [Chamberlinius hualienensis]
MDTTRREQRRRNIINNSENRLKLILNKENKYAEVNESLPKSDVSDGCVSLTKPPETLTNSVPEKIPVSDEVEDNRMNHKQSNTLADERFDCHPIHSLPKILTENKSSCRKVKNDVSTATITNSKSLLNLSWANRKLICLALSLFHQLISRSFISCCQVVSHLFPIYITSVS